MDFLKQDPKFKLQWQSSNTGDMDIRFSGTLFILIGSQPYQCHQGKDLNASKKIYYNEVKKKETSIWTFPYQITKTSTAS